MFHYRLTFNTTIQDTENDSYKVWVLKTLALKCHDHPGGMSSTLLSYIKLYPYWYSDDDMPLAEAALIYPVYSIVI